MIKVLTTNWKRDNGFAYSFLPPTPPISYLYPNRQLALQKTIWGAPKAVPARTLLLSVVREWVRPLGAGSAAEFPCVIPCSPRMGFGSHVSICKILYWFYSNIPYENSRFVFLLSCIRNFFGKAPLCFNCTMQGRHVEATGL